LSNNPIQTFFGFPPIATLTHLEMDQTKIRDFRGFPVLPNLISISFLDTPVIAHSQVRIAVLLITNSNLRYINGDLVSGSERRLAKLYPPECSALVRGGWMPSIPPPTYPEISVIHNEIAENRYISEQSQRKPKPDEIDAPTRQSDVYKQTLERQNAEISQLQEAILALSPK
jgi:hypothetical protein